MKNRRIVRTTLAAAAGLVALLVGHASQVTAGGGLADGEYDCGGGYVFVAMGKIDIQGNRFRYRPYANVVKGFAPFTLGADGVIQWGGPFGGIDEAPSRIVTSTKERWGFNVKFQGNPKALVNTMSCHGPK